jgi:hypothetical protein
MLAMHPEMSWMPSWVATSGGYPILAFANRIWNLSFLDSYREARFFPTPVEPYETFSRMCRHFRREDAADEVVAEAREKLVPLIENIVRYHGKPHYLGKLVGRPVKIELFAKLFPTARFVHVTRRLKPTLSSLLKVHFYDGWESIDEWPWGAIPEDQLHYYQSRGKSEVAGVAVRLHLNNAEVERQLEFIPPDQRMDVAYQDFVRDPVASLTRITEFAGLSMGPEYTARIRARNVYAEADKKWMTHLNEDQIRDLDEFEKRFGY